MLRMRTPQAPEMWSGTTSAPGRQPCSAGRVVLLTVLMLSLVEVGLQVRSHLRSGESVFNRFGQEPLYRVDPELGIRTFTPHVTITGRNQTIAVNRYGLRGEDFEPVAANEYRIALLGASTIMGTFAQTTAETSSNLLQRHLTGIPVDGAVRVINAGLTGTTVAEQARYFERRLATLGVRQVLWYPGTNDVGCSAITATLPNPWRLRWLELPRWTLSTELLFKNTTWLRRSRVPSNPSLRPDLDLRALREALQRGIDFAQRVGIELTLVTNATSYDRSMPPDELARRAASALRFRPCYTAVELATAVDSVNKVIRDAATDNAISLIDMAALMPRETMYFGDASHFSTAGEVRFSALLGSEMKRLGLLDGA